MEIGSRVAYVLSSKARCGVITQIDGDLGVIKLDDGATVLKVGTNRLYLIDNWRDYKRDAEVDKLKMLPEGTPCLKLFKRNKSIVFGIAAIRAMWYWTNHNIFDDHLIEPIFTIKSNRSFLGKFYSANNGARPTMALSIRNYSNKELFAVVMHECIHQMNLQYELPRGEFDLDAGVHGTGFLRWIPIIQEKTGIKIYVTGDSAKSDVDFDEADEEPRTKDEFIFVVANLNNNLYSGFVVSDEEALELLAGRLRRAMRANDVHDQRIYAGTTDLARVKKEFINTPKGNVNDFKIKNTITPKFLDLLKHNFKPVPNFYGPDKINE